MACINPKKAWRSKYINPETNKRKMEFNREKAHDLYGVTPLACGKCVPCLQKKIQHKCIQCLHEMYTCDAAMFLTLTYDDEHIITNPKCLTGTLDKKHLKQFHKSLRKQITDKHGKDVKYKYFQSGEYGGKTGRPHYHVLIMGFAFPDKIKVSMLQKRPLYESISLNKLWKYGHIRLEDAGLGAASYIAKYALKEALSGKRELESLETTGRIPQFTSQSKQIGRDNLIKNAEEYLRHGTYVTSQMSPVKFGQPNKGIPLSPWQLTQLYDINPPRVEELLSERKKHAIAMSKKYNIGQPKIGGTSDIHLGEYINDICSKEFAKYKNSTRGITDTETKELSSMVQWAIRNAQFLDPFSSPIEELDNKIKEFKKSQKLSEPREE